MSIEFLKKIFSKPDPDSDSLFTSMTRPLSYWFVLISFIVLIFLSAFKVISDSSSINYLKDVVLALIGFYFAGRSFEKITKTKSKDSSNNVDNNANNFNNKTNETEFSIKSYDNDIKISDKYKL